MLARTGCSDEEYWIVHIPKTFETNDTSVKEHFRESPLTLNSYTFYFLENPGRYDNDISNVLILLLLRINRK